MELNKIYRYYGIPTAQAYEHMKDVFTETFKGFDGVSFETVEATEDSTESFLIYLNSEKSLRLKFYTDSDKRPRISINFKNDSELTMGAMGSSVMYRSYNVMRTKYGVAFTLIGTTNSSTEVLDDKYFCCFFTVGTPNVFVYAPVVSVSTNSTSFHYLYSNLHENTEEFPQFSTLVGSAVPKTVVCNVVSLVQPIECEHLFRKIYSEDKNGKIEVDDKTLISGAIYALEYDSKDDGKVL